MNKIELSVLIFVLEDYAKIAKRALCNRHISEEKRTYNQTVLDLLERFRKEARNGNN